MSRAAVLQIARAAGIDVRAIGLTPNQVVVLVPRRQALQATIELAGVAVVGAVEDLQEAMVERERLVGVLMGRAANASRAGRATVAVALSQAASALGAYNVAARADGSVDLYGLYSRAFDLVVGVRSLVDAEPLLGFIDDRIQSPPVRRDAAGNEIKRPPVGRPYKVAVPMDSDRDYGKLPMAWYARHVAFGLLVAGNSDHMDPRMSSQLVELAARVVAEWGREAVATPSELQTFFTAVMSALPAEAAWSRRWIGGQQTVTAYHKPTSTEIVREGIKKAVDNTTDAVRPPGGFGVGLLVVAATVAAVATFRRT